MRMKMAFFEDVVITDSIEIKTTPDKIFNFLTNIIDDGSYRAWHKDDHLTFRWIHGILWTEGSIMYAEEYFHGKLHKFTPTLQKSEAFSLCVSEGEAVVNYCDPLIARRLGASDFPAG
jgi:hypothetical protein